MSHTHTPETDALVAALESATVSHAFLSMTNHARQLEEQRDHARVNAKSNSDALAKAVAELMEVKREADHLKSLLFDEGKNFSNLTEEYERLGKDLAAARNEADHLKTSVAEMLKEAAKLREENECLASTLAVAERDYQQRGVHLAQEANWRKEAEAKLAAYERPVDSEEVRRALSRAETADDDFPTERSLAILARAYRQQAAKLAELEQVSGELCEKCGWAFKVPGLECRCELEAKLADLQRKFVEQQRELQDWKRLLSWGGTPAHFEAFIKGQQDQIHAAQIEAEKLAQYEGANEVTGIEKADTVEFWDINGHAEGCAQVEARITLRKGDKVLVLRAEQKGGES